MCNTSFIEYILNFDIVTLAETFVDKVETNAFANYDIYFKKSIKLTRKGRPSGGVICLVKKILKPYVKEIKCKCHTHHLYLLCDKSIFKCDKDILLICAYVHPQSSPFYNYYNIENGIACLEECISEMLIALPDVELLLFGDMNARTANKVPNIIDNEDIDDHRANMLTDDVERKSQDGVLNDFWKMFHYCSVLLVSAC